MRETRSVQRLQRLLEQYRQVERSGADPFSLDVEYYLKVLRRCFPQFRSPSELRLDGEAIDALSSALALQAKYLERMTALLYRDPLLVQQRLTELDETDLVNIFLKVWRPVVSMEQMTAHALAIALDYWKALLPMSERFGVSVAERPVTGTISRSSLFEEGFITEKSFRELIDVTWEELKEAGEVEYWDFVTAPTFKETLRRAIIVSFLVTYGYAALKIDRLEERITLVPYRKRRSVTKHHAESVPISIALERWREEREKKG